MCFVEYLYGTNILLEVEEGKIFSSEFQKFYFEFKNIFPFLSKTFPFKFRKLTRTKLDISHIFIIQNMAYKNICIGHDQT